MSVTVEYLGSGLTICRSMPASKGRGPLHVHSVTIVGSCETATTRSATGQTLPVAALVRPSSRLYSAFALLLVPTVGAVVGDDVAEHGGEGGRVDRLPFADGHGAGELVLVAAGDDPVGVGGDVAAVVEEDVDVVCGREQGADVALQDEVGLAGALDGLGHLGVGGMDQLADLAADGLLPVGQGVDIGVDARVGGPGHGRSILSISGAAGVGDVHSAGEDAGRPGPGRLLRRAPEVRGGAEEQGVPVLAAQGAGDDIQVAGAE